MKKSNLLFRQKKDNSFYYPVDRAIVSNPFPISNFNRPVGEYLCPRFVCSFLKIREQDLPSTISVSFSKTNPKKKGYKRIEIDSFTRVLGIYEFGEKTIPEGWFDIQVDMYQLMQLRQLFDCEETYFDFYMKIIPYEI